MKYLSGIPIIFLFLFAACTLSSNDASSENTSQPINFEQSSGDQRCGDGVCDGPENSENCLVDCPLPKIDGDSSGDQPTVLYIGIMVHLEGWEDDQNQDKFERHVQLVREYASLFETYGAVLTLESKELTDGSIKWGDNVLLEMEQRGHGIGVHADIGGQRNYKCNRFALDLRAEKEQLESLGVTVRHVSGNTSHCDWVTATIDAGYSFTTGIVAYSLSSLPEADRPEEFKFCSNPGECHQPYPTELADRMHPWRANSGFDWVMPDPQGELVILPSSGLLVCMHEEASSSESLTSCEFTLEDIEASINQLEEAISLVEEGMINTYYVSWSLGSPLDQALLEEWLQQIQPYVVSGQVEWTTLPDMYDVFVVWENSH